jgi:hypothetical protein
VLIFGNLGYWQGIIWRGFTLLQKIQNLRFIGRKVWHLGFELFFANYDLFSIFRFSKGLAIGGWVESGLSNCRLGALIRGLGVGLTMWTLCLICGSKE